MYMLLLTFASSLRSPAARCSTAVQRSSMLSHFREHSYCAYGKRPGTFSQHYVVLHVTYTHCTQRKFSRCAAELLRHCSGTRSLTWCELCFGMREVLMLQSYEDMAHSAACTTHLVPARSDSSSSTSTTKNWTLAGVR
eukprot:18702-Heterococcus_DN1.PRE.9